jgi:hypothetical protein
LIDIDEEFKLQIDIDEAINKDDQKIKNVLSIVIIYFISQLRNYEVK